MGDVAGALSVAKPSRRVILRPWTAFLPFVAFAAIAPGGVSGAEEIEMPGVTVQENTERADGPVDGYRATRSGSFTKTDTPLKEVPASVTVVPGDVMRDLAAESMAEALRYVTGLTRHQGEGNRDQFVIRGNSTTADFFVNGMRDDAQVFRDPYNLERIEVLKGPGGMIFGRGGAGGIINRVTKRPIFDTIVSGSVTTGMYEHFRATGDFGSRLGSSAAWRLNLMCETSDTFRDGVDLMRYALFPSFTWRLGERPSLTVDYEHLYDKRTADRGIPSQNGAPFETGRGTFFGNPDQSFARSIVDGFSAVIDHDLGGAQLKNSVRVSHYDKFYQNVFPGSAVNAAGNLTLSAYNNDNERTNIFNQTDLTARFTTGPIAHQILAGLELGRQDSANKRNTGFFGDAAAITVPASHPFATATQFTQTGTDANNHVTATIVAPYVQDQITLLKQLKLLAGVRYDYFEVSFDDRRTTTPAVDLHRVDHGVSPRGALIWTPLDPLSLYIAYSYAFLPSAEQLGLATTTVDLSPETATNYEIGARWDVLPKLTLSAALFRLDRDNVRVNDPTRPGFFVKTGQQRTDGFELGLQGSVLPFWDVFGSYTHLNGRITQPISSGTAATPASVVSAGNKIGLVPEHMIALWNRFELGAGWALGLGALYQSSSFTSFNNTVTLPDFTRVDGALYYTFAGGKSRFALNVENLLNTKYFPTVDGDNNISPGAPITIRATLSASF